MWESHQNVINTWLVWVASLEQIGEAVQVLKGNIWFVDHGKVLLPIPSTRLLFPEEIAKKTYQQQANNNLENGKRSNKTIEEVDSRPTILLGV